MKKTFIAMMLLLNLTVSSFAGDTPAFKELLGRSEGNTILIQSEDVRMEAIQGNPKDWIGVYKVGDSNAWKNVKLWTWVKDCRQDEFDFGDKGAVGYKFKNANLPTGLYEARYFLNNTYVTALKSDAFRVIKTSNKITANYSSANHKLHVEIQNKNFKPNPKDWIGVYKVGDSTAWKNIKAWTWAKNFKQHAGANFVKYTFDDLDLRQGVYRVKYFLNNTYTENSQSNSFKVTVPIDTRFSLKYNHTTRNLFIEVPKDYNDMNLNFNSSSTDWIGIYKVGTSNAWSNVQAWLWVKDLDLSKGSPFLKHEFKNVDFPSGMYEFRYFRKNSFITYKTSNPVKVWK